ncbi:four-carbon acid sugar kinase family protein [Bosea rubneri]|uniref:Four-carbon acid sugar kinase family protein n=1 Tax=Bosea rubneri TaxID=3075434 RepID=A0ABU3S2H6_9HYPH|nr:four-carbon acid sugar kinase family protein [Bosea sp. ZW T0_25]MDU0338989.1 four-carbon acid sugar kinase family protein [Bosea sp. ZW T0_25]
MAGTLPRYAWYGDDFTGSTDTLAVLAEGGQKALLFLRIPTPEQLAQAGDLDALGIAGATRAMAPEAMAAELDPAGRFFAGLGIALLHYKCCSTFDSAPHLGSIGAAVRALQPHFPNSLLPIIGGQPNLGRYCLFGNLFAAAGTGGTVHRIDRHPTMSVHPATPMGEADLRLHLAAQGLGEVGLVDYRSYGDPGGLATRLANGAGPLLFDIARVEDLAVAGRAIAAWAAPAPMLVVGPSSVAQALAGTPLLGRREKASCAATTPKPSGPVLALVGSLSPVTRAQVEAASGYARIAVDPVRLLGEVGHAVELAAEAQRLLRQGDVMLVTDRPVRAPGDTSKVAAATGELLRAIVAEAAIGRLVVAGGDTSTLAVRMLDIWGLSHRAALVPGAPLCRAHSDDPRLDGIEMVLKGGQMGPPDFFALVAGR